MSEWYCCQCKHCGVWQVKEIRYNKMKATFQCQRCSKHSKFITQSKSGKFKLNNYGPFDNPVSATLVIKRIKLREGIGSEEIWGIDCEFQTP